MKGIDLRYVIREDQQIIIHYDRVLAPKPGSATSLPKMESKIINYSHIGFSKLLQIA
jgi:hypothetical protein